MSTQAQLRQLIAPYLGRNDDLSIVGREVFIVPVRHALRGVFIDRTSSKGAIKPKLSVSLLFGWKSFSGFGFGCSLPRGWGYIDNPELPDRLYAEMDRAFDEVLRPASTLVSLFAVQKKSTPDWEMRPEDAGLLHAALGQFEAATSALSLHLERQEQNLKWHLEFVERHTVPNKRPWQRGMALYREWREYLDSARDLLGLVEAGDRKAVANLLHRWEADRVQALKIQQFWEPTPFPLEQDAI